MPKYARATVKRPGAAYGLTASFETAGAVGPGGDMFSFNFYKKPSL
jgi:hypothetical protein